MKRPLQLTIAATLLFGSLAAWATVQAVRQRAAAPASLAAMLPQGALLTIESPDFAALLRDWNASPQQKAWLASDNYSVFSNSRLFSRLSDARSEFETVAQTSAKTSTDTAFDADFLTHVAGRQSIFAWYDIGNLEFIYITRLTAAQAANVSLLKQRSAYTARQVGASTFYMRRSAAPASAEDSAQGKARTVAFAQVDDPAGPLLILATREDLIANALQLIARPQPNSVAQEPWFTEASAALPSTTPAPALHMVLNLDRLVPLPYFRSYWVQRNVTAMKQYRAAVSDLYREPQQFREERVLLLKSPDDSREEAPLAALAPPSGVYRAIATHDPTLAVAAIEEKLLGHPSFDSLPATEAPDPSLEAPQSGSATDLETRIDTPALVTEAASNQPLSDALRASNLQALLTYSTAQPPSTPGGLWIPIHSAVVLQSASAWNPPTLEAALERSLRGTLSTSTLGIQFQPESTAGQTLYTLRGPKPLFFAIVPKSPTSGDLCILTDDRALLLTLLHPPATPPQLTTQPATLLAGFDHTTQRAPYARLTSLIDGTNQPAAPGQPPVQPAFFSTNLKSLSDSFAALTSQRFVERRDGPNLRQTVTYQWQRP